ncbi:MAG: hypothetical protein P8O22_04785 [Akkermansiaceae bacterium]|jgi:hypothetical protein|nr:hypothetical protein [Akkermansiaceae bacterium]
MKSCFSILVALVILVVFIGTAGVLIYTSSNTEVSAGPEAEDVTP